MKKIITGILAFLGIATQAANQVPADKSVMDKMRSMALNLSAEEIGLTKDKFPDEVFGILMETGFEGGSFTLLVLAEGTTSLYFSNGGGIIGAGTHKSVQEASATLIAGANYFFSQTKSVTEYPYPAAGEVNFYLISRKGVTSYSAPEIELGENRDPLSKLFHASHMVISELRQIEESRHNKANH